MSRNNHFREVGGGEKHLLHIAASPHATIFFITHAPAAPRSKTAAKLSAIEKNYTAIEILNMVKYGNAGIWLLRDAKHACGMKRRRIKREVYIYIIPKYSVFRLFFSYK